MTARQPLSRAIRSKFTVKMGVVTFNASVHSVLATESDDLVRLCVGVGDEKHPPSGIKRTDACPICDNQDAGTYLKGRSVGGSYVVLTHEELATLDVDSETDKSVMDLSVCPRDGADIVRGEKKYYLKADGVAGNNYSLMVALLRERPDLMLLTEFSVKGAITLFCLEVVDDVLVLQEIARPNQVREAPVVSGTFSDAELAMAVEYADRISKPFVPDDFTSKRQARIDELLGDRMPVSAAGDQVVSVVDTLAAELERLRAEAEPKKSATPRKRAARRPSAA